MLKCVWKLCALNFQIVAVSRPCIRFFSSRYCFEERSLIFVLFRSKLLWLLNPKGLKNSTFSPKRPTTFRNWDMKTLVIAGYEYTKNFQFCHNGYEIMVKRKKIFCINLVLSDEWIWMNCKGDLCVNQDLLSSITLYPLQQFCKFLHIRNQQ